MLDWIKICVHSLVNQILIYLFFKIWKIWCFLALQNNLCLFVLFFLFYYQQNTRYFDLFCFFLLAHFEQFCPTFVKLTLKTQIKFKICISCSWPKDQRKSMQNHFSSHCSNSFAEIEFWISPIKLNEVSFSPRIKCFT